MAEGDDRRDVQVDIEHKYYEDSGLADAHAQKALDFYSRLITAVGEGAAAQQHVLSGRTKPSAAEVLAGTPTGHPHKVAGAAPPRRGIIALAILAQAQFANPNDAAVLDHCTGVFVDSVSAPECEPQAPTGIRITLTFEKNDYFSNERISRVFGIATTQSDDINVVSADDGTVINWAPKKDATFRVVKKAGRKGEEKRKVPIMSLFRLFTKDGFAAFADLPVSLLTAAKPLIKVAVFTVHAACRTRVMQELGGEDDEEGDADSQESDE
jgi:hypothetical protein